jgi:predicted nucleotidyltransferase
MSKLGVPIAVSDAEWKIIQNIFDKYIPNFEVWAFGSRARFTQKPFSDLDIAVINNVPIELSKMADLHNAFTDSDLPYKVDIVDWQNTAKDFQDLIRLDHVVIQKHRN